MPRAVLAETHIHSAVRDKIARHQFAIVREVAGHRDGESGRRIQHVAPIEGFADEKWDAVMAINFSSALAVDGGWTSH